MNFFEILQNLLNSHNLSQKQLADLIGIRQTTISEWKKNGNLPSGETAIKIANYFNVSLDYLLTGKDKESLTPNEVELLSNYRTLPEHDQAMLQIMVSAMASNV